MSSYTRHAYDPESDTIRMAIWMDNYFERYEYGISFDDGGPVYHPDEVEIPHDTTVWVRKDLTSPSK